MRLRREEGGGGWVEVVGGHEWSDVVVFSQRGGSKRKLGEQRPIGQNVGCGNKMLINSVWVANGFDF
ncbi:hypothetical protein IF2G_09298 [Cordyceps javanica]|nr:hypothetical protein IF2G_09298 [Cordyceps javanica]